MAITLSINFVSEDTFKLVCSICVSILLILIISDITNKNEGVKEIFKIPTEIPIFGHWFEIQSNPSFVFYFWWRKYNQSIFQIKVGSKKVIIVNSYEDVANLWIMHSCQNNSRPMSYTFHNVVSSYQSYTIGTTPFSFTFKTKRKHLGSLLKKNSLETLLPIIKSESCYIVGQIVKDFKEGESINLRSYFQFFVLRCCIHMSYGLVLDCFGKDKELFINIIRNESEIIRLRSPFSNIQDAIQFLRFLPLVNNTEFARECSIKREKYMTYLYKRLLEGMDQGNEECMNSLVGRLIQGKCKYDLIDQEINSICLTLVSAGLDNTPLTLDYTLGALSQPKTGLILQSKAKEYFKNEDNSYGLLSSNNYEKSNSYIVAILLESLRHFTVLPLGLPRETTKPIHYKNILVPSGTMLLMNAYAANHDPTYFHQCFRYIPERWLDEEGMINYKAKKFQHFAFGAGSRMCIGQNLAMNQMYVFLSKFLLEFVIEPPEEKHLMEMNPFISNANAKATSFEPRFHKVRLKKRYQKYDFIQTG